MLRLLAIPVLALIALAVFSGPAEAKSPYFRAEISGGSLSAPVMVPDVIPAAWMDSYDRDAPASAASGASPYTLRLFDSDAQGTIGDLWTTFTYYPSAGSDSAAIYTDGHYMTVFHSFAQLLDKTISQDASAQPQAEDGGTSVAWWYVPSALGLGLLAIGSGLAGRRVLKRREVAAG